MVASTANGAKVLLVEDSLDTLTITTRLLRLSGLEVTPCSTAEDAEVELSEADQRPSRFQLMISDWNLERQNAALLVEHACRLGIPVLVVTGRPHQVNEWLDESASPAVKECGVRVVAKGNDWLPVVHNLMQ